jgi:RNA polymerase sigma-70 factor, ECF subfamily
MLLARIDREELGRFFDKYHGPVYSYLRHRVLDEHIAEDLLAETFLEAVSKLGRFRFQKVTFGAYLFRIAQRRVARHFRQVGRQPRLRPLSEEHLIVQPDGPAVVQAGEDAQLVALCIGQLADADQDIVILHYYEQLKLAQVAVIMKMHEETVKKRLIRARQELARLLEDPEIKRRLSREGRRALQALRQGERQMRLLDGGERGSHE